MWNFLLAFIPRAIVQGIPLLYGSTGEIVTEKSGNLNLGIPGVMYVGAISGVIGSFFYERAAGSAAAMNPVLAILIPNSAHRRLPERLLLPDKLKIHKIRTVCQTIPAFLQREGIC